MNSRIQCVYFGLLFSILVKLLFHQFVVNQSGGVSRRRLEKVIASKLGPYVAQWLSPILNLNFKNLKRKFNNDVLVSLRRFGLFVVSH